MGAFGYPRPTTPRLDAFAAGAAVFERAYAPGPFTYASVPALLTGVYPTMLPTDIMRKKGTVPADQATLADLLGAAGWDTALISDNGGILRATGADKGFASRKSFNDDAAKVTAAALGYLDGVGDDKFFLWVDYFGPHASYRRHPGGMEFGDEFVDLYDHEIRWTDGLLAQLLDRIDRPDLRGRTVVMVFADHGEAFGEHGTWYHGHHLHEENVHVPLLMRVPGLPARRIGAEPVSLLDLFPTVLALAHLPVPADARGHDLMEALATGAQAPGRHVFIESVFAGFGAKNAYHNAVVTARHKLMEDTGTRQVELYDLARDPGERDDLMYRDPETALRLRRAAKYFQSFGR
jgi:arylsulfatase A-like enzyme